jgi:glutaredoxin
MLNIYTKTPCPACIATKTALTALGVPYNELELTDPDNLTLVKNKGFRQAPVVHNTVTGEWWSGFNAEKIALLA